MLNSDACVHGTHNFIFLVPYTMMKFSHCPPNWAVLSRARARTEHPKRAVSTLWEQVSNHCTPFFSQPHQHYISLVCSWECHEEAAEISLGLRWYHISCTSLFSPTRPLKQPKAETPQAWHGPFSTILVGYLLYQFIITEVLTKLFFNSCFRTFSGIKSHTDRSKRVIMYKIFFCIKVQTMHMSTEFPKSSFQNTVLLSYLRYFYCLLGTFSTIKLQPHQRLKHGRSDISRVFHCSAFLCQMFCGRR